MELGVGGVGGRFHLEVRPLLDLARPVLDCLLGPVVDVMVDGVVHGVVGEMLRLSVRYVIVVSLLKVKDDFEKLEKLFNHLLESWRTW